MYPSTVCVHAPRLINHHFRSRGTSTLCSVKGWFPPLELKHNSAVHWLDEAPVGALCDEWSPVSVCMSMYMQVCVPVRDPKQISTPAVLICVQCRVLVCKSLHRYTRDEINPPEYNKYNCLGPVNSCKFTFKNGPTEGNVNKREKMSAVLFLWRIILGCVGGT